MRTGLIIIIGLLLIFKVNAADPYPVQYLGIENGLSNNAVTCIYQDHNGFMWFGTYDGLNRYDGYAFKVFRNKFNDSNSLANNRIVAISEDHDNNLWIGTTQGISIYNNLSLKLLPAFFSPYQKKTRGKITMAITDIKTDPREYLYRNRRKKAMSFELRAVSNRTQYSF